MNELPAAVTTEPIADFFDRECCSTAHANTDDGPDALADALINSLEESGFRGGTVLEIGSGAGALSRALLERGAETVTGLDLSPQSVSYAAARAASLGLGEMLTYRVADAATVTIQPHDAVVSKAVLCCYPAPAGVLANTLPAAGSFYALVLPESRGLLGLVTRLVVRGGNAWQWLRRDPFRGYVHDVRLIDRTIRAAGFQRRSSRRHRIWRILAYSRV